MSKLAKNQEIFGDKVKLRKLKKSDIEMLRKWRNGNRNFFLNSAIVSTEQQKNWFENYKQKESDIVFILETLDGIPVGSVSLYHIDQDKKTAEYGRLMIDDQYKRKGYAEDATKALIDFAFLQIDLNKIILKVIKTNNRAINLYNKLGFKVLYNKSGGPTEVLTMILINTKSNSL